MSTIFCRPRGRLFTTAILLALLSVAALGAEPLELSSELRLVASTESLPHWLIAQRWNSVDDEQLQGIPEVAVSQRFDLGGRWRADYGLRVAASVSEDPRATLGETYGGISFGELDLRAGRFRESLGTSNERLGTGSFVISSNALPMPRIRAAVTDYVAVPYTRELFWVKAHYGHGWFEEDRYRENTYLHEKSGYLRLGDPEVFAFNFGLVHVAQYGGNRREESDYSWELDDYRRVVFPSSGDLEDGPNEYLNILGNHLGVWDWGVVFSLGEFSFTGYYQHYFEDKGSLNDGGRGLYENHYDGLWGLSVAMPEQVPFFRTALYEFAYTKDQSGPKHTAPDGTVIGGRDSYYSNGVYSSGWSYLDRILGNSLFSTGGSGEDRQIANNRFSAQHLAFEGELTPHLALLTRLTWVRYFEAYAPITVVTGDDYYDELLLGVDVEWSGAFGVPELTGLASISADFSTEFDTQLGGFLGLRHRAEF